MRRLVVILVFGFGIFSVSAQQPIIPPEIALLWEQALAQPQDFAVACAPVDTPWEGVLYNADSAFPLASVSKLLIYLEYARRIDTGLMSYSDVVSASILDRYNLPRTDRGAHDRFMETYAPGTQVLSLWEVAGDGMIQYSSNAASDYMLDRMAPIDWSWLYTSLALSSTSPPHSLTMIPLLMNNHLDGQATLDNLDGLSIEQGEEYLNLYVQDEAWRQAEIDYRSERRRSFPPWPVQAAILQRHTAVGSARDFLTVMDAVYGSGLTFSENVKSMTRTALRWTENAYINNNYVEYGSKLGFYSGGVLTLVAYGQPFNGIPVISVTFLRNIPQAMYRDMLDEDSIGNFAHWLNFNGCGALDTLLTLSFG